MKSLAESYEKFFRLSPLERRLFLQAWVLLLAADFALRTLPFTAILNHCRRLRISMEKLPSDAGPFAARTARLVEAAGQYCPTGTSCLKEALVLSRLLSRHGVPTTLRIGVNRHNNTLTAHAWLEQDGRIILGGGQGTSYAALPSLTS